MPEESPKIRSKIYFIKDAEQIIGRNRLTLRRWWKRNNFPQPTLINGRLAWLSSVVHEWIKQNVHGGAE